MHCVLLGADVMNEALITEADTVMYIQYYIIIIRSVCSRSGAVVQRVERWTLRSVGRGFKSYSRQRCVTTLGKLFTPMCLCHQAV